MTLFYRILLSYALFFLSLTVLPGQAQPPSVSAAALAYGQYADIPVNHHTGTGNVMVPLHTVSDGPLALPIFLQYHTAGIQVNAPASDVGLGWNLNAGGLISRTVKGQPDDKAGTGYYHNGHTIRYPTDQESDVWYEDSEPDVFTYNFPGGSGKFFFDANQDVQMVPRSDIKVKPFVSANGQFDRFVVTITDGTEYFFGRTTAANGYEETAKDYVAVNESIDTEEDTNGWFLIMIRSADGNHRITLSYDEVRYSYTTHKPAVANYVYREVGNGGAIQVLPVGNTQGIYETYFVRSVVLSGVETTHESVSFNTADRNDLGTLDATYPAKAVTGLEVQNGNFCTSFEFNQSYFGNNFHDTKLKLNEVQKKSCDGTVMEPAWTFDYDGSSASNGEIYFPATNNHDIDHWGYYNLDDNIGANDPNETLTPPTGVNVGGITHVFGDANREPNENAMKQGMLERITYPTGGFLELTYEANRYQKASVTQEPFTLESCPTNNCPNTTVVQSSFTYTSAIANATNPRWQLCIDGDPNSPMNIGEGKVEILDGATVLAEVEFNAGPGDNNCISGGLPTVGYATTNQPMIVGQSYTVRVTSNHSKTTFRVLYDDAITDEICGGLRIKQTRIHDGLKTERDIIRDYSYDSAQEPGVSSGIRFRSPRYAYTLNQNNAIVTSLSQAPLNGFDGYHIGYQRVVVDHNGIGKEEFLFDIEEDQVPLSEYPLEPNRYKVTNGRMTEQFAYSESGQTASHSTITKNTADYEDFFGGSTATGYIFSSSNVTLYYSGTNSIDTFKLYNAYFLNTSVYRPKTVVNSLDGVTSTVEYEYGVNNLLPEEVITTNSNGDEFKTISTYSSDYNNSSVRIQLTARNMIHLPFKVEQFYNNVQVNGGITDYRFYKHDGTSPSTWAGGGRNQTPRVYSQKKYEKTWDANGNLTGSGYELAKTITTYTSDGLPHTYNDEEWPTTTVEYDNKRIIRKTYLNHVEEYDYYPNNSTLLREVTAVDGTTASYTFDALGRLETATDDCKNIVKTYDYGFGWGGQNVNYVEVKTDYPDVDRRSALYEIIARQYKDGLGRDIVGVTRNVGPSSNEDIINGVEYDQYGRVLRTYEPFAKANNFGNYDPTNSIDDHTLHTYEASPLSRKTSVTPPDWHATTFTFGANSASDEVRKDGTSSFYAAESLRKSTTTDANGNKLIVFTDKAGQKILSRRTDGADLPTARHDTYYLYDGKNRLTTVVPPGATATDDDLVFSYRYNDEDQVVWKKIPDKEPVKYWYNSRDELTAQQDANLLGQSKWYAYDYDDYGRPTKEGFHTGPLPFTSDLFVVDDMLTETIYGTTSWEKGKVKTIRTRVLGTTDWLETTNTWSACGLLEQQSGNNHRDLDLVTPEITTYTYDGGDNLVESVYSHHFPGNNMTIEAAHNYDYAGRNISNFFTIDNGTTRKLNFLEYDEKNNVATKYQGGTGLSGALAHLQKIDYSYLTNGMLEGVNLAGLSGSQTGIPGNGTAGTSPAPAAPNASLADDKDLFYYQLYRDQPAAVSGPTPAPARFNGDISFVASQVRGRRQQLFGVKYDTYDRMTEAKFYERFQPGDTGFRVDLYSENLTYDERGNIETLNRRNLREISGGYHQGEIDALTYSYSSGTNRLQNIDDTSLSDGYNDLPGSYTYDDNGNMTSDPSKGITVTYNHLDLPTTVQWTGQGQQRLEMTYDAAGTLLRRQSFNTAGTSVEIRDYIGGIEYVNNTLESIMHEEGRVYYGGGTERWDYALTDHLGNTRLLYADLNGNGIPEVPSEIVQEAHYLPFGMKMAGPWMGATTTDDTKYGYNGIEHVDDFDLGVDMAMYRTLDPVIGRWWSVDPKAEYLYGLSPYNAMNNSPAVYNDPNGDIAPLLALGIVAAAGGVLNLGSAALSGKINSPGAAFGYFASGAVGAAVAVTNPGAGYAITVAGNLATDALSGNLPATEDSGLSKGLYVGTLLLSGFNATGAVKIVGAISPITAQAARVALHRSYIQIVNEAGKSLAYVGSKDAAFEAVKSATRGGSRTVVSSADLLKNAALPHLKNGVATRFTVGARAVSKHPQAFGFESFQSLQQLHRTPQALNALAQQKIQSLIQGGSFGIEFAHRVGSYTITIRAANGTGARWLLDGKFLGFLN